MTIEFERRSFIQLGAASTAGLVIACGSDGEILTPPAAPLPGIQLQTWLRITADNAVTIAMHKAEMGQGVHTALPLLVAEELDLAIEQIQVELVAEIDDYNLDTGLPLTYGSTSVSQSYLPFRKVGAAARAVLIKAAAAQWAVPEDQVSTEDGACVNANGDRLTYGDLVEAASQLEAPEEPALKDRSAFKLIGRDQHRLIDDRILDGTAIFGIDSARPDGLYAAIRHAPTANGQPLNAGSLTSKDPTVRAIVELPHAIAVVATSFWNAKKVVEALPIEFSTPKPDAEASTTEIRNALLNGLDQDGLEVVNVGDVDEVKSEATKTLSADYEVPHIAHVPLEPVNATAHVTDSSCELWLPTQAPSFVRDAAATLTGLDASQITVHPALLGGGFGRKSGTDYADAAIRIAQVVPGPITLIWSREEDMRRDQFRPAFAGRMVGMLDANDKLSGWDAINCGDSVLGFGEGDPLSPQGFGDLPYAIANQRVRHVYVPSPIKSGFWRSIGHSQNTFFAESFIDEMAHLAGTDPVAFRLDMLGESPRTKNVIERAAKLGRWGEPFTAGASQGIAICTGYGSFIAVVCEASVDKEARTVTVHHYFAVVDCGTVVQPTGVKAQVEGGLLFGLSAARHEEITFAAGQTEQSNFSNYSVLLPSESPDIEVELVESDQAPSGVGELAVGPAAPALANAIFAASGLRCRSLPFDKSLVDAKA